MSKYVFIVLLFTSLALVAEEVELDYTRASPPAGWTQTQDENGAPTWVSPRGTQITYRNFGYDIHEIQSAAAYAVPQSEGKLTDKTNKRGLKYITWEGTEAANPRVGLIGVFFYGYRYQGTQEEPTETANGFLIQGTNLKADRTAIDEFIHSLVVQPRHERTTRRYSLVQGGMSFEVPTDWIRAPFMGTFTPSEQFIHPNGSYLHTEILQGVKEGQLEAAFKKGYNGYPDSILPQSTAYTNKAGVKMRLYHGYTDVPTNPNHNTHFTVLAVPFPSSDDSGLLVMVGPIGDPSRLTQIMESIRLEKRLSPQ